jgi:hypothetical protein
MSSSPLRCPICGKEFESDWAVACHVAGKVRHRGDKLHASWSLAKIGHVDKSLSVPKLAEKILWYVHEEIKGTERERSTAAAPKPLYECLREIETTLHDHIRKRLQEHYGEGEDGWWDKGIPLTIREDCVKRREGELKKGAAYEYTDLIDLHKILDKNWGVFEQDYKRVSDALPSKKEFLDRLAQLNRIRNAVMHPVKQAARPDQKDIEFVEGLQEIVRQFCT